MNNDLENIIIDSASTGLLIEDNDVGAVVSIDDVTALLALCALYNKDKPYKISTKIGSVKYDFDIHMYAEELPKQLLYLVTEKGLSRNTFEKCKTYAKKYFHSGVRGKGFGKKITIRVGRVDADEDRSFIVYPSQSVKQDGKQTKEVYYLNFSCAPTTILKGENSLPIKLFNKPKNVRALIELPVCIVSTLIQQFVMSKVAMNSSLPAAIKDGRIYVNRLQIAMYTAKFGSKPKRDHALMLLFTMLNSTNLKIIGGGISVPEVLKCKIDTSETTYEKDENNKITAMSGFLCQKFTQGKHEQSVGFYAKDMVAKDVAEESIPERIRLDVTLQSNGLKKFCKRVLNLDKPVDKVIINSSLIESLFTELFTASDKTKDLIDFVLFEQLRFDQFLGVTRDDWESAFDILKKEGYHDFVDKLREWGGPSEKSFTSIVEQSSIYKDALNKERINKKTGEVKPCLREQIFRETGVDITFPYPAWRAVIINLRNLFISDEQLLNIPERRKSNNINIQMNERAVKLAYKRTKQISSKLRNGGASYMPTQR